MRSRRGGGGASPLLKRRLFDISLRTRRLADSGLVSWLNEADGDKGERLFGVLSDGLAQ